MLVNSNISEKLTESFSRGKRAANALDRFADKWAAIWIIGVIICFGLWLLLEIQNSNQPVSSSGPGAIVTSAPPTEEERANAEAEAERQRQIEEQIAARTPQFEDGYLTLREGMLVDDEIVCGEKTWFRFESGPVTVDLPAGGGVDYPNGAVEMLPDTFNGDTIDFQPRSPGAIVWFMGVRC